MMNHPEVGTGHLVFGLIAEGEAVACQALTALGADTDSVRERVVKGQHPGGGAPRGHIPLSPRVKKANELALRESLKLGHRYVGTEHVLLGLIDEGEETGVSVLVALGISPADLRAKVMELLGYDGRTAATPTPREAGQMNSAEETVGSEKAPARIRPRQSRRWMSWSTVPTGDRLSGPRSTRAARSSALAAS